ncbi:MAG: hypothetical protein PHD01_02010 [Geobacteraceae bacterium]|nr:hypothetical protein [Geobacteraceae bacterium]
MTRDEQNLAEKKLLLAIHGDEVFKGKIIRQERPFCCGADIDLLEARLTFVEVKIRNRIFTLLEPYCPLCGRKAKATFHLLN